MDDQLIEFHCPDGLLGQPFPSPRAAAQDVPGWLKQMPVQVPQGEDAVALTVKKCPPFVDAMTGGYLIPLVADVHFTMGPKSLEFRSSLQIVSNHPLDQLRGSPFEGRVIVKFLNPWIVKTPPGYSCLFTQPLNRGDIPFYVISGVVDTDTYYNEINFPSICLMTPGTTLTLKAGTPIVQVLPFRRERWKSSTRVTDEKSREPWTSLPNEVGRYKDNIWTRKLYE